MPCEIARAICQRFCGFWNGESCAKWYHSTMPPPRPTHGSHPGGRPAAHLEVQGNLGNGSWLAGKQHGSVRSLVCLTTEATCPPPRGIGSPVGAWQGLPAGHRGQEHVGEPGRPGLGPGPISAAAPRGVRGQALPLLHTWVRSPSFGRAIAVTRDTIRDARLLAAQRGGAGIEPLAHRSLDANP